MYHLPRCIIIYRGFVPKKYSTRKMFWTIGAWQSQGTEKCSFYYPESVIEES